MVAAWPDVAGLVGPGPRTSARSVLSAGLASRRTFDIRRD